MILLGTMQGPAIQGFEGMLRYQATGARADAVAASPVSQRYASPRPPLSIVGESCRPLLGLRRGTSCAASYADTS